MTAADQWAVAVRKPIDRGNPLAGYDVVVFAQRSEANARQVFAGRVKVAGALGYESVMLRCNDVVIERWPSRG